MRNVSSSFINWCNARLKFASEAVKILTNHPRRFLDGHQNSFKHINATKQ